MKKKLHLQAIVFLFVIAVLGCANFLNFNKPTVSELENRALEKKPRLTFTTLFDGSYFLNYGNYYSDTFILRDQLVRISRSMRSALSLTEPGISLIVVREDELAQGLDGSEETGLPEDPAPGRDESRIGTPSPAKESPSEKATPVPATPTPTPVRKDFDGDKNVSYWMVVDGKAIELFKFNKEAIQYYTDILNKYREKLPENVSVYSLIAPTAGQFVQLRKYKGIADSQNDAIDFLYSKLDSRIHTVNAYDAIGRHKDEYIYFRTDHHWTALGAYYGYAAFMEARGEAPVPLNRYEMEKVEGFLGSSYKKTLNPELAKNPDTIELYLPFTEYQYMMYNAATPREAEVIDMQYAADGKDKYLIFMSGGGATWSVIKTEVKNGKKLLVIKDSFGNAFVPFLLPHYEEIYVVDSRFYNPRYAGGNILEFIAGKGVQEVLFLQYMEDVNWTEFMAKVEGMLGE